MRVCMSLCVCSKSSLKQLGQLKPNFMWNHNGIGEENLFKGTTDLGHEGGYTEPSPA